MGAANTYMGYSFLVKNVVQPEALMQPRSIVYPSIAPILSMRKDISRVMNRVLFKSCVLVSFSVPLIISALLLNTYKAISPATNSITPRLHLTSSACHCDMIYPPLRCFRISFGRRGQCRLHALSLGAVCLLRSFCNMHHHRLQRARAGVDHVQHRWDQLGRSG